MPELSFANLCHPVPRKEPFTAEGWLFEQKHDGYRALIRKSDSSVELQSRTGRSMTKAFPEIISAMASLGNVALDAELIVPDSTGRSDYRELRRRLPLRRLPMIEDAAARQPAALMIFDVLQAEGKDLRALPLSERKAWLRANVTPGARLQIIEGLATQGEAMFAAIQIQGFEGIVAKRLDAPYKSGRQPSWLKIKNPGYRREEAVSLGG